MQVLSYQLLKHSSSCRLEVLVLGNMERIKEQPRALNHAPLTNIRKSLDRSFATVYFVHSFFFFGTVYFCNGLFCGSFLDFNYLINNDYTV